MATHTPPRSMDEDPTIRLRTLALFSDLPVDELDQIATTCDLCTAHPGQVIQAQDVPVRRWHLLIGGHAIVQRHGRPIGLLGRGDSWSEHSLLNRQPSPIAVVALSPVTMLTVREREFFAIPEQHPVLAGRLVARSASSPDRLAVPVFNALAQISKSR
jgi:signal-transduction protein with cAMP-binding, CBS, and nucleotidyltransferase domain